MDTSITALEVASIGLFGVFVGSAITTAKDFILAVRRERAEERKARRDRANEFRIASRLICEELLTAGAALADTIKVKRWWVSKLLTEAWQKHKSIIAAELSAPEWVAISTAFGRIDNLQAFRDDFRPKGDIEDSTAEWLGPSLQDIRRGQEALCPTL